MRIIYCKNKVFKNKNDLSWHTYDWNDLLVAIRNYFKQERENKIEFERLVDLWIIIPVNNRLMEKINNLKNG